MLQVGSNKLTCVLNQLL